MEIIKKKIHLENYISRQEGTWGQLTANTFNINVFISQDIDDMGVYTDLPFTDNPLATYDSSIFSPDTRFPGKTFNEYLFDGINISGVTEDRLDVVKSYDKLDRFKLLFKLNNETIDDYQGVSYNSVTKVVDNNSRNPISYGIDIDENEIIDTNNPKPDRGILLKTYSGLSRTITSQIFPTYKIPLTEIYYKGQSFNETNTTLSALTKEEYLFGITDTPEVQSDVFIDRGRNIVQQSHMQLGEIDNMEDLINYGNGFYKFIK